MSREEDWGELDSSMYWTQKESGPGKYSDRCNRSHGDEHVYERFS